MCVGLKIFLYYECVDLVFLHIQTKMGSLSTLLYDFPGETEFADLSLHKLVSSW